MLINLLFGYIDPGLGSLLVQFLIAGIVGAGFCFRKAIGRLLHIFKNADRTSKKE